MKRPIAGMAATLLAAVLLFSPKAQAISAQHGVLLDAGTGRLLFDRNADAKSLIASTTKIMTALIVCEQCNVLDRIRIPKEAVGIEGSSMYLKEGEILTIQDLLYGLMLHSGNDAAVALALYCGGTVEGFAELMNDKAHMLGLHDTHFVNPHGLDAPGHYSTAEELAVLGAYAMENPIFAQTVSTKQVAVCDRYLTNHNKLLWRVEGVDGIKTGFTKAAGRILVSTAIRDGRRLVAVTINAPDDWNDHATLLEKGFSRYTPMQIVKEGECLGTKEIAGGEAGTVELIATEDFSYALTPEEKLRIVISGQDFVYAPVVQGQGAGYAYVLLGDKTVGKIPIVYGETIEQEAEPKKSLWERLFGRR